MPKLEYASPLPLRSVTEKTPMTATSTIRMIMKGRYRFMDLVLTTLHQSSSFVLTKVQFHHLLRTEGGKRIGFASIVAELNFEDTVLPLLDNRTHFATAQTFRIQVFGQSHDVK